MNDSVFNWAINLLKENYPREKVKLESKAVLALWREYFTEELTEKEFAVAVKHVCLNFDFLPAPSKFVEHIHGAKEVRAIQEWQNILGFARDCQNDSQLASLGDRARVALQAIGGLFAVGLADHIACQRLEKSFITVYCQCSAKDSKSLPQASSVTTQEVKHTPVEASPMPEDVRQKLEALKGKFGISAKAKEDPAVEVKSQQLEEVAF